jgi:hypothetical protein
MIRFIHSSTKAREFAFNTSRYIYYLYIDRNVLNEHKFNTFLRLLLLLLYLKHSQVASRISNELIIDMMICFYFEKYPHILFFCGGVLTVFTLEVPGMLPILLSSSSLRSIPSC